LTITLNGANIVFAYRVIVSGGAGTTPVVSDEVIVEQDNEFFADGVTYRVLDDQNNVAVVDFDDSSTTPVIPTHPVNPDNTATIYKVTEIGEEAFMNKSITAITLPNTVTVIRARAFKGCTNLAAMSTSD
jgi:hypothetical protein